LTDRPRCRDAHRPKSPLAGGVAVVTYRGWFRPLGRGHRWRPVATGTGYRECWRALLDVKLSSGELIVLAEGKRP
jgi:hypothetical protein